MPEPTYFVEALASTIDATAAVCADLTDNQWDLPTGCPGWSVKDHVAHLYGLESVLAGAAEPDHELVGDFPHVRDDTGWYMERQVDARRHLPGTRVLEEFRDLSAARLAYLRSLDDEAFKADSARPDGLYRAARPQPAHSRVRLLGPRRTSVGAPSPSAADSTPPPQLCRSRRASDTHRR